MGALKPGSNHPVQAGNMSSDIISKRTRYELREFLVANYSLRQIDVVFDSAEIPLSQDIDSSISGERRGRIDQYYRSLDFTKDSDARRFLQVYKGVLEELSEKADEEVNEYARENAMEHLGQLKKWLKKDGLAYDGGQIIALAGAPNVLRLKSIAVSFDAPYIYRQINRMEREVESDPCLAIGTAKELIETTCKTILKARGTPAKHGWSVPKLVHETCGVLQLTPGDIQDAKGAAKTIKRVLGNLAQLAHGIAELRNPYGTGHGPHGRARGLDARHARLAVGAATTLATFLFETHRVRRDHDLEAKSSK